MVYLASVLYTLK